MIWHEMKWHDKKSQIQERVERLWNIKERAENEKENSEIDNTECSTTNKPTTKQFLSRPLHSTPKHRHSISLLRPTPHTQPACPSLNPLSHPCPCIHSGSFSTPPHHNQAAAHLHKKNEKQNMTLSTILSCDEENIRCAKHDTKHWNRWENKMHDKHRIKNKTIRRPKQTENRIALN